MSDIVLSVKDLSIGFKQDNNQSILVKNVSFDLYQGETLALVGESGSGKTISALSVLGLLPYPQAFHPSGSILYNHHGVYQELLNKPEKDLQQFRGKNIGMVFQEPLSALNPLHTVERQVLEPLLVHNLISKKNKKDYVVNLLEQVELKNASRFLNSYPHQLSGGQRQRVMIAQALACNPSILIADEPTTALDVMIQEGIIELLQKLKQQNNMSILLISHDLNMVRKLSDRVCVMEKGVIVEEGGCHKVLNFPEHQYTKKLIHSEPHGFNQNVPKNSEILSVQDLSVFYKKKNFFSFFNEQTTCSVNKVSFDVKKGETLGIVGESGSGKSSLVFAILNLLEKKGKVLFNQEDITHFSKKKMLPIRRSMQIVFQDPYGALNPRLTIREILEEGLLIHFPQYNAQKREAEMLSILNDVQLTADILSRYPHEFSGGQRQRISIARSVVLKPSLLALDEPTSALDKSVQKDVLDMLLNLQNKYALAYLFISHDLAVVQAMSHRMIVMQKGRIVEQGLTKEMVVNPQHEYTKKLFQTVFSSNND